MSIVKLFLLCSAAVCYVYGVGGVGVPTQTPAVTTAPASTVTLYQVYQATPSGPQSGEIVGTSILDIGTNSAGTETTISVGQFISISESSEVLAATTITLPAEVLYSNYTIVESSGGFWESAVLLNSASNGVGSQGVYESCSFSAGGSAFCTEIFQTSIGSRFTTVTETFEGITLPLTVMTVTAAPSSTGSGSVATPASSSNAATTTSSSNAATATSSSNAAMPSAQRGSLWKMTGLHVPILLILAI